MNCKKQTRNLQFVPVRWWNHLLRWVHTHYPNKYNISTRVCGRWVAECVSRSDPICVRFIVWRRFPGHTGDTQGGLIGPAKQILELLFIRTSQREGETNFIYLEYWITVQIISCLLFQWCEIALDPLYLSSPEPNMESEDGHPLWFFFQFPC